MGHWNQYEIREWEDTSLGKLEVERWPDGDVIFRSTGTSEAVLLHPAQLVELIRFIKWEDKP